ncbi:MAG: (2Fe-2S)-binding protein [Bacteroidales bacterium]|nr:(2Fe-2S)-binding protein [Bacteroidales bacterium]
MEKTINFTIDGKECSTEEGKYLVEAAKENGVFIPTLCNYEGLKPKGSCRICTVKVKGRLMTACTSPVQEGMVVENNIEELNEIRRSIIELLFVSGNHFCPACEKSGNCELQALAYRYQMMAPRFPFLFPQKEVDASHPKIIKDQNRCILCKRCIRGITDDQGRSIFAYRNRSNKSLVVVDPGLAAQLTEEKAKEAMDICPVGSILVREKGFDIPIGERKYDKAPIGSEFEQTIKE